MNLPNQTNRIKQVLLYILTIIISFILGGTTIYSFLVYGLRKTTKEKLKKVDPIVFQNELDGELVLSSLKELIETYGYVNVQNLNDLVGLESKYHDRYIGWYNLDKAKVIKSKLGYYLDLPSYISIIKKEIPKRQWYSVCPNSNRQQIYARHDENNKKYYDVAGDITKIDKNRWIWRLLDNDNVLSSHVTWASSVAKNIIERQIAEWEEE